MKFEIVNEAWIGKPGEVVDVDTEQEAFDLAQKRFGLQGKIRRLPVYAVVAYASSGENTCRGCLMERWDSWFEHESNLTRDQAVEQIAKYLFKDHFQEYGSIDDLVVFEDSVQVESNYSEGPIIQEAQVQAAALIKAEQDKRNKKIQEENVRQAEDRRRRDLEQLRKLKEQYEK